MKYISEKLVAFLVKDSPFWNDKRKLLTYAFELLMDKIIMATFIIIFAILTNTVIEAIVTFVAMSYFRNQFPGFHFKNFYTCIIFSLVLFYLALGFVILVPLYILRYLVYATIIFDTFFLLLLLALKVYSMKIILTFLFLIVILVVAFLSQVIVPFLFLTTLSLCYSLVMHLIQIKTEKGIS